MGGKQNKRDVDGGRVGDKARFVWEDAQWAGGMVD